VKPLTRLNRIADPYSFLSHHFCDVASIKLNARSPGYKCLPTQVESAGRFAAACRKVAGDMAQSSCACIAARSGPLPEVRLPRA